MFRFRHLLSQEASAHSVNQSLVAIREHGILISDELKTGYQPFWVIGYVLKSENTLIQAVLLIMLHTAFSSEPNIYYETVNEA